MKLAINGGKKASDTYIPYGKQWIDDDDIDEVIKVLKSDYLTTGPKVLEFEKKVANYVGSKYAVAFSNGTAALHGACFAAGITKGDEVITSPLTFAASANCVLYMGGMPVFADINIQNYNIDINDIKKRITNKTKAIIPVDFTGQSVDMDEVMKIANENNLIVIEDAAHALGSEYKGKKIGQKAHMTEFSFHPVKHITTGEGGVITTNYKELYEKLMLFRTHGITRDKNLLNNKKKPSYYYEQIDLGYNYRMTDIQCALGISQMDKLDKFIEKRRDIVKFYNKAFANIKEIITPFEEDYSKSAYHLYIIRLELDKLNADRDEIYEALQAENIGVNVHYIPVYKHPYYKELGYKESDYKNTQEVYNSIITLPLYPKMSSENIDDVVNAVIKVINYYKI
ncbi:MAG: UDP-4-amino-4,6-dideoxy-N-acetyl-beta-L-altrosamine transaminase [Peptostreptococcaceae bacterium]|jgi:UDP-4-amino-4,6-dideoxy-N-acetyl-beta-L-altrosamine transaminase|nr:UDP-4-amino-4,6-dideoxy-N-acetyl-beta-L-altrosamine transaminase [Peptostreptococcaceae bacterium]